MSKKLPYFIVLTLALMLGGCNPQGAEYIDELDLVISIKDNDADFSQLSKYAIADTVVFLSNNSGSSLSQSESDFLLGEIKLRFTEFGWNEVDTTVENPDVLILVSVLEDVNVATFNYWWDYWYGWGGWGYYPGYPGGYYPYYPGYGLGGYYTSVYAYREGTLLIEMVDPNNPIPNPNGDNAGLPVLWGAGINGLLEGSKSSINNRVSKSLDQVFKDSPYLDKN